MSSCSDAGRTGSVWLVKRADTPSLALPLIVALLAAMMLLCDLSAVRAQQTPLELLLEQKQRARSQAAIQPPRRSSREAQAQRAPRRVQRARTEAAASVEAIIRESEPRGSPALPPLPGLLPSSLSGPAAAAPGPGLTGERRIVVLGDSLGVQLGQGLREAFAGQPVMIDSFARADTGLVNASIRDWPKVSAEIAQSQPRPDLVVILVGANDNQKLPGPDGKTADQLSEPWRQSYGFRVDGVLTPLRNARIPVIWVGLPVMRNARLSAAMLAINSVFQERAERQGMNYVDIWEQFSDDAGAYAADGPDIDGTMTRIRAGDGVHFTKAGSRKLAFFVEQEITKALAPSSDPAAIANLPADLDAQIRQQDQARPGLDAALTPPGEVPLAFPIKPASGPIRTLTAQPQGSVLLAAPSFGPSSPADAVLLRGETPYPKPRRADDFSWPR